MGQKEKEDSYTALVKQRKACTDCRDKKIKWEFKNPSSDECKIYDSEHIGNLSTWANNLNAEIIIVAQDYADWVTFDKCQGKIQEENEDYKKLEDKSPLEAYSTDTNYYLRELTKTLGENNKYDIGPAPSDLRVKSLNSKVFLTNCVLCLKAPPMIKAIPPKVSKNCGTLYLKELIRIIEPKIIITLGLHATKSTLSIFSNENIDFKQIRNKPMRRILSENSKIPILGTNTTIFPVYHPSRLGQKDRKFEQQVKDWEKIKVELAKF